MFLRVSVARLGSQMANYKVKSLRLPGYDGDLGFMAKRLPIMGIFKAGLIHARTLDDKQQVFATTGGFFEMVDNRLTLIFDAFYTVRDLEDYTPDPQNPSFGLYKVDADKLSAEEKKNYVLSMLRNEIGDNNVL
jgi:hypothetical protein